MLNRNSPPRGTDWSALAAWTLLALVLALACSSAGSPHHQSPPPPSPVVVIERIYQPLGEDRIVHIPVCGGVAVTRRLIATAAHCIPGAVAFVVTAPQWESTSADYAMGFSEHVGEDRGFVTLDSDLPAYARHRYPELGEPVVLRTLWRAPRGGHVLEIDPTRTDIPLPLDPGDSGSPLFAARDGALVGVAIRGGPKGSWYTTLVVGEHMP